jgi:LmbE family N-acetylglucosaminyl deacetylase
LGTTCGALSTALLALTCVPFGGTLAQAPARTLVAVFAHPDDETSVGPMLARYAREGARVFLISATDGSQGGKYTSIQRGDDLGRARSEEARCAAQALGIEAPILLGFPDGRLGDYLSDPSLTYRLSERLLQELQRLQPDALVTWGPDGGTGHPDHRIVSSIVTQLVRSGAPGVPERLFYSSIPAEGMRVMNPARGAPLWLVPQATLFTVRVSFTPGDFEASRRSMACHRSQYSDEVVQRVTESMKTVLNGALPLVPAFPTPPATDLFP